MSVAAATSSSLHLMPLPSHAPNHGGFVENTLAMLAAILEDVCATNDQATAPLVSKFHAASLPPISIFDYLKRIYDFAGLSDSVFVHALILVDRIQRVPLFLVQSLNIHRLLITCLMVSAKFLDDSYYNNAYFARIGGLSLSEINSLEVELLFVLNFDVVVTPMEFHTYNTEIDKQVAAQRAADAEADMEEEVMEELRPPPVPSPMAQQKQLWMNHYTAETDQDTDGEEEDSMPSSPRALSTGRLSSSDVEDRNSSTSSQGQKRRKQVTTKGSNQRPDVTSSAHHGVVVSVAHQQLFIAH